MTPILRVRNIGKRYTIGTRVPYHTIRETVRDGFTAPWRKLISMAHRKTREDGVRAHSGKREIWALNNVSFDLAEGEILGIVGRNGAGKSTLLKILSRITEPTTGRIEVGGRIGSLLEVGTGFHPELTGRENLYLSGAILGMRRAEIERKFDEIVAFAEVEDFLDTAIKHYSSGMYVRLAFAVAAHLEPEILIVDEVLAVGDLAFQKKCLGKMGEVAKNGRTVIFVSHNMAAVQSLSDSCLLLAGGHLLAIGKPNEIVMQYAASELTATSGHASLTDHPGRASQSLPVMKSVTLLSPPGVLAGAIQMGAPLSVEIEFSAPVPIRPTLGVLVKTLEGMSLFIVSNRLTYDGCFANPVSDGVVCCEFETLPLMPGTYSLSFYFGDFGQFGEPDLDVVVDAIRVEIVPADSLGTGQLPPRWCGPVFWTANWRLRDKSAQRGTVCYSVTDDE